MKKVRVGLAGCGFAGHIHSRSLLLAKGSHFSKTISPQFVVAVDIDINRAKTTARQYGWENVETDWHALSTYKLDLIIVALPNGQHVDIVKMAHTQNIAVLLEKPVAQNYEQAIDIWKSVGNNPKIRVGYVNRFVPAVQQAKLMITAGDIGDIRMFRSVYLLNMRRPGGTADWRFDKNQAGHGASDDLGSHHIDIIHFLAGNISNVQSATRTWDIHDAPKATNDDAINSLLSLDNGAFGTLSASRTSPGHPLTGYIEIEGSKGALRIDRAFLNDLFIREDNGGYRQLNIRPVDGFATMWASPTVQGAHPFSWYDCFAFQMAEMLMISSNTPLDTLWSANLEDGIAAMTVTEAMLSSSQNGTAVNVTYNKS